MGAWGTSALHQYCRHCWREWLGARTEVCPYCGKPGVVVVGAR